MPSHDTLATRRAPDRILSPAFVGVFVSYLLISLGLQMSNVVIGGYTDSLGATPAVIGLVAGAFAITALVFKCVSAPAIDAFDRRFVLVAAAVAIAVAIAGYGLSRSVPPIIAFRLLQGAGQAFTATCCIALVADTLPRHRLGTGMGLFALAPAVAQMIGPTVALSISRTLGYPALFFTASVVMVAAALVVNRIRVPVVPRRRFRISPGSILAREVAIPAVLLFLLVVCYSLVNPFLALWADEQGAGAHIGLFFTVYAASLFVSRPLAGRLADRFGFVVLVPFFAVFIASFVVIGTASALWLFLVGAVLLAFGYGAVQPVLQATSMRMAPAGRRGAASCTTFIGSDVGDFVGPVLGGTIASGFGYAAMWPSMAGFLVVAAVLVVVLRRPVAAQVSRATECDRPAGAVSAAG